MRYRRTTLTAAQHRLGFTLIELLVVIVILGLLVGLLVPAVMNAMGTAKDAACAAEIRAMSQALADFKSRFNAYPPSRIIISESGDYTPTTLGSGAPLGLRSLTYLRKFWPRMQFNTSGTAGAAAGIDTTVNGKFYDVNGNGNPDGVYILSGPECLVLFLGGVPQLAGGNTWSVTGFSKNPVNPFQNTTATTNRTVPFYEFNNSRLVSNTTNTTTATSGYFPGYLDSFGKSSDNLPFYAYFSAYEGVGYDPDDVNFTEPDSSGTVLAVAGAFTAPNSVASSVYNGVIISSLAPNPYTNDVPVATGASGAVVTTSTKLPAWQNAQSFQIISCGRDRVFGIGGQYLANGNDRLPFVNATSSYTPNSFQTLQATKTVTGLTNLGSDARRGEKDNVTNFSAGKLD